MNYLRGAVSAISAPYQYYKDINPSTLTGAIDVIVVKRPSATGDPELACTPFHVRFGKWQVLRPSEKKVDVAVNGNVIPFNMKVGEAGEAFFVFETEDDVPEELITSPILQPTRPEEVRPVEEAEPGQFMAPQHDDDAAERTERLELTQEPDFLDLNAPGPTPSMDDSADRIDHPKLSSLETGRIVRSLPSTPLITPSDVLRQDHSETDSLSRAVDQVTASPANGEAPAIIYTDNIALDAAGYHYRLDEQANAPSYGEDHRSETRPSSGSPYSSTSPSKPSRSTGSARKPGHVSSVSRRKHNLTLSDAAVHFPMTRATSEPPLSASCDAQERPHWDRRQGNENIYAHDVSRQEFSWEWGGFPQPSGTTVTSGMGSEGLWNPRGIRPTALSDAGRDMDGIPHSRGRSELGVPDHETVRSHSVPPGFEGSLGSNRRALKVKREDHDQSSEEVDGVSQMAGQKKDDLLEFGHGGKLIASRRDPTQLAVRLERQAIPFELSICDEGLFDGRDEIEVERVFEAGKIDFQRLLEDSDVVSHEGLVIRWAGGQYISHRDNSPLMDALRLWRDTSIRHSLDRSPSPQWSPSRAPSPTSDEEDSKREKEGIDETEREVSGVRRSHTVPISQPVSTKPTSSSWVRWWSRRSDRNKEVKETEKAKAPDSEGVKSLSREIDKAGVTPGATVGAVPSDNSSLRVMENVQGAVVAQPTGKKYAKTLRLTSDQLKLLNLKPGPNIITFSLSASGTVACTARIFVWDSIDLVVVSDIDGTITKSDGLGHVFAMIGRDWTHSGVAKLYTDISRNGYNLMYLTSRAIGQADSTRDYLKNIKQDNYQLPEGPVIMSPDRLIAALHREIIVRKPEVFKVACLRDILRLFGETSRNPFYAGFGNRITDALSYRSVNIPSSRIFTIDHTGEVKMELLELAGYKSSYIHMTDLVDQMFPPIHRKWAPEFTDFNYWKTPMWDFPLPDLSPPSPSLSVRSDTSNQSALNRLRNFGLVSSRRDIKPLDLPPSIVTPEMSMLPDEERATQLKQMSSFERLSSTISSLTGSLGAPKSDRRRSLSPGSYSSSSVTYLDSGSEGEDEGGDGGKRRRRVRTQSITSMPGSLDDMTFDFSDEDDAHARSGEGEGHEEHEEGEEAYDEEVGEDAFDEDFLATGEMKNVPFL